MKSTFFLLAILSLLFLGCSSAPTFQPEVDGAGAISSHGAVVYSIPPKDPILKMKLVSMVIPKKTMVHVRLLFIRKGTSAGEYLDPKEQSILLPDSTEEIFPAQVHANGAGRPLIRLADASKQAVELLFPVPKGGKHEYPFIKLSWKIHYRQNGQDKVMAQTERFDYVTKTGPQQGVGQYEGDLEFPDVGFYAPLPEGWFPPGWLWW